MNRGKETGVQKENAEWRDKSVTREEREEKRKEMRTDTLR